MGTQAIVEQLKKELKVRSITYGELGRRLKLSEAAVKRLFAAKNFSLRRFDEICDAIGADVFEITLTASRDSHSNEPFSVEVEQKLASDPNLLMCLYLALQGSTAFEIQKKLVCDQKKNFRLLRSLEKLRLIEIHQDNRIRCIVREDTRWRPGGPLFLRYGTAIKEEFFASNFDKENEFQDFLTGKLSRSSFDQFLKRLRALFREFNELTGSNLRSSSDSDEIFWMYAGIRPWAPIGVMRRASKNTLPSGS